MSYIGPITNDIINACIREFKKKDNREKISKQIIDPVIREIYRKCYPFAGTHLLIQLFIIFLLIYIIINLKKE